MTLWYSMISPSTHLMHIILITKMPNQCDMTAFALCVLKIHPYNIRREVRECTVSQSSTYIIVKLYTIQTFCHMSSIDLRHMHVLVYVSP
jgi:hypothetical protein